MRYNNCKTCKLLVMNAIWSINTPLFSPMRLAFNLADYYFLIFLISRHFFLLFVNFRFLIPTGNVVRN